MESILQKNSATTDEEIYTESRSLEKERYLPESEQSLDTCMSGLTTCNQSWEVCIIVPITVSFDVLHVQVCMSPCTSVCQSSRCLLSSLRIPLKVLLSLSTQTNDTPWCHFIFPALLPISLPAFPWTSSALVSHPASLFVKRVLPAVSFLVTRYLSLPVSFFLCRVPA